MLERLPRCVIALDRSAVLPEGPDQCIVCVCVRNETNTSIFMQSIFFDVLLPKSILALYTRERANIGDVARILEPLVQGNKCPL